MKEFIKKYLYRNNEIEIELNTPAKEEQIAELERQLGIDLPSDYRDFLKSTNGFEGFVNDFYAILDPVEKIFQNTKDKGAEFFQWAVYIGTNGNAEMFVIDKRQIPFQFGLLPFIADTNDFIPLGDTFEKFIERLYKGTAFQ